MKTLNPKYEVFNKIKTLDEPVIHTGINNLDTWWSAKGGIVVGTSIFLTGTSGAGKTTLSVFLAKLLNQYKTMLYSREMHRSQIKEQTDRLNVNHSNFFVSDNETCPTFNEFMTVLDEVKPKFVVVDSLQIVALEDYGNDNQETAQFNVIQTLRNWIKDNNAVLFVIGHNTKDGEFRGANTIMQMFDAHIEMVHHKKEDFRTIAWGQKNRKGPLGELFYEFTQDSIEFYTEEEWNEKVGGVKIVSTNIKSIGDLEIALKSLVDNFEEMHLKFRDHKNFDRYVDVCRQEYGNLKFSSNVELLTKSLALLESNFKKYIKK